MGNKSPKKLSNRITLKTLQDLPFTTLESLPTYSPAESQSSIYSCLYPFIITKYDNNVPEGEFRELLLDVHGFILSQPIFSQTSYRLFETITDNPSFIEFIRAFVNYYHQYNQYLLLKQNYETQDWRRSNITTQDDISIAYKETEDLLQSLCDYYSCILLQDTTFENVTVETEVYEGLYQFVSECARRDKEIESNFVAEIQKQINNVIRCEKFNHKQVVVKTTQYGKPPFMITNNGLQEYKDKDSEEIDSLFPYKNISEKRVGITPYDAKKVENLRMRQIERKLKYFNNCIDVTEEWRTGKIMEKKLIEENDGLPVNFQIDRKKLKIRRNIHTFFSERSPILSSRMPPPKTASRQYQRPRKSLPQIKKSVEENKTAFMWIVS